MHYDAKQFLQKRFSAQPRGTVIQASHPTPWTRLLRTSQWHLPPVLVRQDGGIFLRRPS